ncbi:MAG: ADP-ribosylglycohydrolase family protein [Acidimicrobiales bacterium]
MSAAAVTDRMAGALLGLAAGDALGATVEFLSPAEIQRGGRHTEIRGGGVFGWRAGQGTDDTDLAYAVARSYVEGYSLSRVADHFLAWHAGGPRDVGGTTAASLRQLRVTGCPELSGFATVASGRPNSAGNGSLMRCLATGLVRHDPEQRRAEAVDVSAVTHADRRCTQACVAYCDLVDHLIEGTEAEAAVGAVLNHSPIGNEVRSAIAQAPSRRAEDLDTSGFVLATLQVGVWALLQPSSLEDVLVTIVNLGGDADTTAAVAGGLLGARHGAASIPRRWVDALEYRETLLSLVPGLLAVRQGGRPSDIDSTESE